MACSGLLNAAPRTLVVAHRMVTELQAGEILDGRFEIAERIGHGDVGSVFKATDLTTGGAVAVKMLFEVENDPAFLSRFQREIEMARRLDHPGILKILAVGNPSRPYLVTEHLEGETLDLTCYIIQISLCGHWSDKIGSITKDKLCPGQGISKLCF